MHPEVVLLNIGLLTLLYAKITYSFKKVSFKYSILNDTVKKLKQLSLSAGNLYNIKFLSQAPQGGNLILTINGTSETTCNETVNNIKEDIKNISIHIPKHLKPISENSFGHYLAGLIEGDGHFSSQQQLVIVFHSLDVSLAYYIKERLGYGSVKKVKNTNAYIFIISSRKGLEKVINLINGKIRTENKFNQITKNILNHENFIEFNNKINFTINLDKDLKNHWLAGFSDAGASFQIKIINRNNRVEVRLNFQIDQKNDRILRDIKKMFGGNIGYRKNKNTYYYGSTSFGSAKEVINYFDSFQLLSSKHVNFLKWRKAYLIIQEKKHLKKEGLEKIIKLKNTMNSKSGLVCYDTETNQKFF